MSTAADILQSGAHHGMFGEAGLRPIVWLNCQARPLFSDCLVGFMC